VRQKQKKAAVIEPIKSGRLAKDQKNRKKSTQRKNED